MTLDDVKSKIRVTVHKDWLGEYVLAHLDFKQMVRISEKRSETLERAKEHAMRQMIHRLYADRRSEFCELVLDIRCAMRYHDPELMKLLDKLEAMSSALPPKDV